MGLEQPGRDGQKESRAPSGRLANPFGKCQAELGELPLINIPSSFESLIKDLPVHLPAGNLFKLSHLTLNLVPLTEGNLSRVAGVRQFSPSLLQILLKAMDLLIGLL